MVSDCHLLSCHWASVRRTWLHLLYMLPSDILRRGQGSVSWPAGDVSPDAAQDAVGLPEYKDSLLAHIQLVLHHDAQVVFCRAALQTVIPEPFLQVPEPPRITHLTCQALLRVLDCLSSCWGCISPVIQVTDGAVGPYLPLGCSSSDWPWAGLCAPHQSPLDPQFSCVSVHLSVHLSNLYFSSFSEAFMSECFESLAGVKVNNICCSPCITELVTSLHKAVVA